MKTTTKFAIGSVAVVALSAGVAGVTAYAMMEKNQDNTSFYESFETASPLRTAAFDASSMQPVDLTKAAESTLNSVVHIMSIQRSKIQTIQGQPDIFDFFFGDGRGRQQQVQTPEQRGFGSGVIISKDGYIVTNNHVIDGADEINVKLHDGREMKGRVIGTDPTTDLALVKIEGDDFPAIVVGNSDNLKVGEWVLAVGNPFNLGSTVTAGVVSAKSRGLGANQVESFIQTDAAINQGNSGGALVNAKGELVGINAMLYSPTGAYSGYGFAIPVSIMTKVVTDLKQYGTVQPFVENAIVHGFENVSTCCKVTVTAAQRKNRMHFEITDTGIGMSQSQIDEIWEEEPDAYRKQRIGRYAIKNIRERLERRYKEDFILEIKSEVGKGTTVILELPCEEK